MEYLENITIAKAMNGFMVEDTWEENGAYDSFVEYDTKFAQKIGENIESYIREIMSNDGCNKVEIKITYKTLK